MTGSAGSARRHGKGWEVRVYAGVDPSTGRKVYLHGRARTKKLALERGGELLDEYRRAPARDIATLTFRAFIDEWWAHASQGLKTNTRRVERDLIDRYVLGGRLDHLAVAELTARHLDAHYRTLNARLAPSTVRRVHGIIRRALQQAVKWEATSRNAALVASPPTVRNKPPAAPAIASVNGLLAWLDANADTHSKLRAMVTLAADSGARPGELCGLRWSDIDTAGPDTVTIVETVARGEGGTAVVEETNKTEEPRIVPIDPATSRALRDWHKKAAAAALAAGRPLPELVFTNRLGQPWSPGSAARELHRARVAAGVDDDELTWYGLRHYVATQLVAAGHDPKSIADRLGHDPAVLLTVYAASVPAKGRDLAAHMASLRSG